MSDITPYEESAGYEALNISRRALKALSGIDGLTAGPLSPLARMQAPPGAADAGALASAWETLNDVWRWAVPALVDPHRTIALVMGDGNTNLIGQYLFPDAEAYGPGFQVSVGEDTVSLTGPLSLDLLGVGLYSHLALEEVAELEPSRIDLAVDHFWILAVCLDAYRSAALERRVLRAGGVPLGVSHAQIVKAWADGTSLVNPGWTVSLFSLLVPDEVPHDLPERLPRLLPEMSRQGLLLDAAGPEGTLYAFSEALSPLLWGLTTVLNFGLVTQRLTQPQTAESTVLGGWRTPGGIWLADLSDMRKSGVSLVLSGPALADNIIGEIFGDDTLAPPWEEFVMDTPYTRDALVPRLHELQEREVAATIETTPEKVVSASPGFCTRCGEPLREGARFCRGCGAEIQGIEAGTALAGMGHQMCPSCGNELQEGLSFCNACGEPLQSEEEQLAFCPNCGNRNRAEARFCRECGRKL